MAEALDDGASILTSADSIFYAESLYENGAADDNAGNTHHITAADESVILAARQAAKAIEAGFQHDVHAADASQDAGPAPPAYAAAIISIAPSASREPGNLDACIAASSAQQTGAKLPVPRKLGNNDHEANRIDVAEKYNSIEWETPSTDATLSLNWLADPDKLLRTFRNFSVGELVERTRNTQISWKQISGRKTRAFLRRHWLNLFWAHVTFTLALLLLITFRRRQSYRVQRSEVFPEYLPNHPQRSGPEKFHEQKSSQCKWVNYSRFTSTVIQAMGNFSIAEAIDANAVFGALDGSISGIVEIMHAPMAQSLPIEVYYNVATTAGWSATSPLVEREGDALVLTIPEMRRVEQEDGRSRGGIKMLSPLGAQDRTPCLDIWIGIYVKTEMSGFNISTDNLDVYLGRNPKPEGTLHLGDSLNIRTKKGNVDSSITSIRAEVSRIKTKEGNVTGNYLLSDSLIVSSQTGDISMIIDVQPRLPNIVDILEQNESPTANAIIAEALRNVRPSVFQTQTGGSEHFIRYDLYGAYAKWPPNKPDWSLDWIGQMKKAYPDLDWPEKLFYIEASHFSHSGHMELWYFYHWAGTLAGNTLDGSIDFSDNMMRAHSPDGSLFNSTLSDDKKHLSITRGREFGGWHSASMRSWSNFTNLHGNTTVIMW